MGNLHLPPLAPIHGTALPRPAQRSRHAQADTPPVLAAFSGVGSAKVSPKNDLPKVPAAHKGTWVRIADPSRTEVHLTAESKSAVKWLQQCFAHDRLRPLQQALRSSRCHGRRKAGRHRGLDSHFIALLLVRRNLDSRPGQGTVAAAHRQSTAIHRML